MPTKPPRPLSPGFGRVVRTLSPVSARRVLVAEDDDDMRTVIAQALRADGYDVAEARDGGSLLAQLTTSEIRLSVDLLISDVRMPFCSGVAVLESMRRAQWTMPVIMMTAFGDDATREAVERLGGVLFDKPFAMDDLRTAVLNLMPAA
jgi:DNA-binding response OmpR family regulator